jgi:hypothetical protein
MKRMVTGLLGFVMFACLLPSALTLAQPDQANPGTQPASAGFEPHPRIYAAIRALEAARGDLQSAAHDYCGHRVEALEATNAALGQLGRAIECDNRRGASADRFGPTDGAETVSVSAEGSGSAGVRERHPLIRQAVNALRSARSDLQHAAHDYCGHRVEALEATNAALNQLGRALACDRD